MKIPVFVLIVLLSLSASAQDKRVRNEVYDSNTVYPVYTAIGRASLIQFEDDESLAVSSSSLLGVGDADAWEIGVRGNNLVLKPKQRLPQTNIVVVTNKRTYALDLIPQPRDHQPTYVLRFIYPDSIAAKALAAALAAEKRAQITSAAKAEKLAINTQYVWRGENHRLKPTSAFDDGIFTRLVYNHGGELPLFYKVLPDGSEALINSNVDPADKSTIVLHEVTRTVRVRLGRDVGEIINRAYVLPAINSRGASDYGVVRVERSDHE